MTNHFADPIGYISMHAGDHDASGVIRPWIMTDLGWRACDGMFYNRAAYPRLWAALPDRRRGDEVQVPRLSNEGKPYGGIVRLPPAEMSPHSHWFDRGSVIGTVESASVTPQGVEVKMKLNDYFTEQLKKGMVDVANLESVFPEFHGLKGMTWGDSRSASSSTNKENNMATTKLKTPTEDIQRKDLTVAMRLLNTNDQDSLLHALALVQELGDNQTLYRASELEEAGVLGQRVKLDGKKVEGILTDVQPAERGYSNSDIRLVVDGKIELVGPMSYVTVNSDPEEPLGEDALRVVRD